MGKKRNKKFNPHKSKYNPVVQGRKIEKLDSKLLVLQQLIEAIAKSHDLHISYLANFARHDIKNAIQSMDSILSTTEPEEFNEERIQTLSTYLEVIRNTIDNFAKLVPYTSNGKFSLDSFMTALELLSRANMQKENVDILFDYQRNMVVEIGLPLQAILQLFHNLLINSIKSLESIDGKRIIVASEINNEDILIVTVKDNGKGIPVEFKEKIFEYGFTTTGGSGIGLFHAKYLCEKFAGSISLDLLCDGKYTKVFTVKLPINQIQDAEDDINY